MAPTSYDEAVAGWATHLRAGGTTTWSVWVDEEPGRSEPTRPLPDAVHLELVRLLNEAAGGPVDGLAERVLATASPGRGLVDVPLPWPAGRRGYGSPATDPGQLPVEELIRLAVGVLVHLLPGVPRPPDTDPAPAWPLPWRRRFLLHGAPGTAAAVRRGLLRQGLVESGWRPTHVVLARPVEVMMAEHWAASARDGGILKWSTLWRRAAATDHLPPPIDIAQTARRLASDPGEQVHVVVARDAQEAAEATARLLRVRPLTVPGTGDLAHTDLLRRVNRLAALTAGPDRVRDLASRLTAALVGASLSEPPPPPLVPAAARDWARDWAREQARTIERDLRAAGYAVHGSPADVAPAEHRQSGTVDRTRTLELALAACLRTWHLQGGTP